MVALPYAERGFVVTGFDAFRRNGCAWPQVARVGTKGEWLRSQHPVWRDVECTTSSTSIWGVRSVRFFMFPGFIPRP
jgi:hypothetical protein